MDVVTESLSWLKTVVQWLPNCSYHKRLVLKYCIASNYGPGVYFFPATFHPGIYWLNFGSKLLGDEF